MSRKDSETGMSFIPFRNLIVAAAFLSLVACASTGEMYLDSNMDFGAIQNVAIMPFSNLTKDQQGGDRVRDVLMTSLLASEGVYVIPAGEVAKGIGLAGIMNPTAPSKDDVVKLAPLVKADAVITGVLREYGEVRSGGATANVISLSLQMMETQTGKVIWAASVTKGGIKLKDRLLGGGGEPLNDITKKAVDELINKLFM